MRGMELEAIRDEYHDDRPLGHDSRRVQEHVTQTIDEIEEIELEGLQWPTRCCRSFLLPDHVMQHVMLSQDAPV